MRSFAGQTPLIRINSLSKITGCEILGKCEFLNPGGSVKDRIALRIIQEAERKGEIFPNSKPKWKLFEGTSGSTGISISLVARALGYEAEIVLPDDTAREKSELIEKMGAKVIKVRPVSIVNSSHYVNIAKQRALDYKPIWNGVGVERGFFVNQFDNLINSQTHYESTGLEIWEQTEGQLDYFVSGSGTGGTLTGIGKRLKENDSKIKLILADPPGSGLFHKVWYGVMYCDTEAEGKRRRHQMDTIVEGIGLNRSTKNFEEGLDLIDDAIRVTDQEAIKMSRYLVNQEGLFLGSSSAVNLVGCVKLIKSLEFETPLRIVCILCDSGQRHLSKFWNDEYLLGLEFDLDVDEDFDPMEYF
ncbi:uncharacterized protein MELLADRAFT_48093 [Melampsora larici-populina 98AG31]|uniref:cysteine synthase n=1 Tax=Melampsora larici-populina (strain 98AG31 / pathotype 3-4-7) TaxID=747676 RepID=F4RJN1_MELLP|nr:uncharacterized protein MELLADRAFT_48093 [Melampsora larici-populina 98AG31]EGG07336.1 hypothetical protein MELLADRAFT_48093 [Melampsora larici-populina 98AG31]